MGNIEGVDMRADLAELVSPSSVERLDMRPL